MQKNEPLDNEGSGCEEFDIYRGCEHNKTLACDQCVSHREHVSDKEEDEELDYGDYI